MSQATGVDWSHKQQLQNYVDQVIRRLQETVEYKQNCSSQAEDNQSSTTTILIADKALLTFSKVFENCIEPFTIWSKFAWITAARKKPSICIDLAFLIAPESSQIRW